MGYGDVDVAAVMRRLRRYPLNGRRCSKYARDECNGTTKLAVAISLATRRAPKYFFPKCRFCNSHVWLGDPDAVRDCGPKQGCTDD